MPQNCLQLSASVSSNYPNHVMSYVTMDIFCSDVLMVTDFSPLPRYQMLSFLRYLVQIDTSIMQS